MLVRRPLQLQQRGRNSVIYRETKMQSRTTPRIRIERLLLKGRIADWKTSSSISSRFPPLSSFQSSFLLIQQHFQQQRSSFSTITLVAASTYNEQQPQPHHPGGIPLPPLPTPRNSPTTTVRAAAAAAALMMILTVGGIGAVTASSSWDSTTNDQDSMARRRREIVVGCEQSSHQFHRNDNHNQHSKKEMEPEHFTPASVASEPLQYTMDEEEDEDDEENDIDEDSDHQYHPRHVARLPVYTADEVAARNGETPDTPIWMSYGGIVYDVTDFIPNHPGGSEKILMAAGTAMEPYWHIYRQHFASELPLKLLQHMIVRRLDPKDQDEIDDQMELLHEQEEDPYEHEPDRHRDLHVHGDTPMNAEVPTHLLTRSCLTPNSLFYIRHHHPHYTEEMIQNYSMKSNGPVVHPGSRVPFRRPNLPVSDCRMSSRRSVWRIPLPHKTNRVFIMSDSTVVMACRHRLALKRHAVPTVMCCWA